MVNVYDSFVYALYINTADSFVSSALLSSSLLADSHQTQLLTTDLSKPIRTTHLLSTYTLPSSLYSPHHFNPSK